MKEEPLFNLKAVIRQTGLKPDTLRAWERRYGVPAPQRSAGGHRLYSQDDIRTIKWLTARQQEGMSIKQAVELWSQMEKEGQDPLYVPAPLAAAPALALPLAEGTIVDMRRSWIEACLAYDERQAEQILTQAFALYPPELVCLELLQRAVAEMGTGWYRGEVTVQQEHFCSALAMRHLEALIMATPPPTRTGRVLVACPPGEQHTLSLLLLTVLLRRRGWEVIYLGADVPGERLETTMATTRPHLVILAAQQLHSAATLLDTARVLRHEGLALAYGGLIFNLLPALRNRIPGHFLGEELAAAAQVAEALLVAPRPLPDAAPLSPAYRQAREHFQERHWLIEVQLNHTAGELGIAPQHYALAHQELAANIDAALGLGDMGFLSTDIEWVAGLLKHHQVPAGTLYGYLAAYYQAAREQLDDRGQPILAWLARLVNGNGQAAG
jgi:DNA-binding transcriptional MerR regulator